MIRACGELAIESNSTTGPPVLVTFEGWVLLGMMIEAPKNLGELGQVLVGSSPDTMEALYPAVKVLGGCATMVPPGPYRYVGLELRAVPSDDLSFRVTGMYQKE